MAAMQQREDLQSVLQRCITREYVQSVKYEEHLLRSWYRARERESIVDHSRPHAVDYAARQAECVGKAQECRQRREYLMEKQHAHRFLPQEALDRSEAVSKSWKTAEQEVVSKATQSWPEITHNIAMRIGVGLLLVILMLTVLGQLFRRPYPLKESTLALDLDGQPTNMSGRISRRLSFAEQQIASSFLVTSGFPEVQHACDSAQIHMQQVRELWVESGIFDEPLEMDVRTAEKLEEIANEASASATSLLDLAAFYHVLPDNWMSQRAGVRMAAVLEAHKAEKAEWAVRARKAVVDGETHLQAARREVRNAQTVWLPIEAKEASTPRGNAVVKAWQKTAAVCELLEAAERGVGEEVGASTVLAAVWKAKSRGGGGGDVEDGVVWNASGGGDIGGSEEVKKELLSQNVDSLRRWAKGLRAAAECRVDADCRWI